MLKPGPAKKVCVYVSEDQQYHGNALYAAILDYLFYRGVAGATSVNMSPMIPPRPPRQA